MCLSNFQQMVYSRPGNEIQTYGECGFKTSRDWTKNYKFDFLKLKGVADSTRKCNSLFGIKGKQR